MSGPWALSCYEMLTGARPFHGTNAVSLFKSILNDPTPSVAEVQPGIPRQLTRVIARALEKDPDRRYGSAGELAVELAACRSEARPLPTSRLWLSARSLVGIVSAAVIVGSYFGTAAFVRGRNERWARQQALPEIDRLVEREQFVTAFDLVREAGAYLADDPALARIWPRVSVETAIATEPPGADVSFEPYTAETGAWRALGQTPIERARLPRGPLRLRVRKEGYEPVLLARNFTVRFEPPSIALAPSGAAPDMVMVPGDSLPVNLSGFNTENAVALGPFAIDRTEVTNRSFKQFVDAGGYDRRELWPAAGARTTRFVDASGQPGPGAWELGYTDARGDEPVRGVSWYEASAYCAFRGKQLPTVFHWARAALAPREISEPLAPSIVPLSNFAGQGPAAVARHAGMGPYGTYDMAGNVREWVWNVAADGRRWILGGAWNDPDYMFSVPFSLPPDDRSAANGFRCMQTVGDAPLPAALLAPVDVSSPDYRGVRPVSDEVYSVFMKQFAYMGSTGGGRLEQRETIPTGSVRERVRVDAGYGDQQLTVYVFLPPEGTPPYQALLYFPALSAFQSGASSNTFYPADHVVKSGRALVMPVFKGSFERWDSVMGLTGEEYRRALRVRLAEWRQDAGRTLDYLATRGDIDMSKVGYYGRSLGASMPLALLALEPRFRVAVLHAGGFTYRPLPAEVDPVNYVSHVRVPTLLLSGRHDYLLPLETSQKPFFTLLGTAPGDKKHVIYEAGHDSLPRTQLARESLAWLDRYLGQPAQARAAAR